MNQSVTRRQYFAKNYTISALRSWLRFFAFVCSFMGSCHLLFGQDALDVSELKKLSFEDLMNIEVTSVSKTSKKLSETASAIQVITSEDIKRFGATRLPEALRLASNLEVAQRDAGQWAISARGFNASAGNKLLVLIDGRTVYSPLFAGMFWDIQDVLLEDVDRIEVISGPGGSLWGANAVNGVINIITKRSSDTQGLFVMGGGGKELQGFGGIRYGAKLGSNLHFRAYGKYSQRDPTVLPDGNSATDNWHHGQGGIRLDWEPTQSDFLTLQGDVYQSRLLVTGPGNNVNDTDGANVVGRWLHTLSEKADFTFQFYFDKVDRTSTGSFKDAINTFDVDFQHRFEISNRNKAVWGGGYRMVDDNFESGSIFIVPGKLSLPTVNIYARDELALIPERLNLMAGIKLLHNYYTDFEYQPNVRLAWLLPAKSQTIWAAVSRAVRTPSRIDSDIFIPGFYNESPNIKSEVLLAYELGYRVQPNQRTSLSLATYYNVYDNIRSVEKVNAPAPFPIMLANGQEGESYGTELTLDHEVAPWWRLQLGYTEFHLTVRPKPGSNDMTRGSTEASDPQHYLTLRSEFDLPLNLKLYPSYRYVSHLPAPMDVPAYSEIDLRLGWEVNTKLEISMVGQNLLHDYHAEFGPANSRMEIQRNIYGKLVWRF